MMNFLSPIMFGIVPIITFGIIGVVLYSFFKRWNQNRKSPRLKVMATVVSKREEFYSNMNTMQPHVHTGLDMAGMRYYVTFQVESGDRMEFMMSGPEYGIILEGDRGMLSFQGTEFISFDRVAG